MAAQELFGSSSDEEEEGGGGVDMVAGPGEEGLDDEMPVAESADESDVLHCLLLLSVLYVLALLCVLARLALVVAILCFIYGRRCSCFSSTGRFCLTTITEG